MSDSLRPYGLELSGYSVYGDSPGKDTGVGCLAFLQGIFPTQELNPHRLCVLPWQVGSLSLVLSGKPKETNFTCLLSSLWQ